MSILKEINLVNDGVLFHWDGNNQHFSLFEPEYFGEKEKDQSYFKYQLTSTLNWYYGKEFAENFWEY